MLREFSRMWTRITGQSEAEFLVAPTESDPANVMEAGLILPEPGHEHAAVNAGGPIPRAIFEAGPKDRP
jgi:hypothetical protein